MTDTTETEAVEGEEVTTVTEQRDINTFDAEVVSVTDGDTIKVRINGQSRSGQISTG